VLVQGKPSAQIEVPDIPALSGLLEAGSTVWVFPEGQPEAETLDLVWPGFQTYGLDYGVLQGDRAIIRLLGHDGAGKFLGFGTVQDEVTPPEVFFNLTGGIAESYLGVGTHRHMAWAFTQGGVHRLRFELQGTLVGGATVKSAAHTYRFFLGELSELPATEPTIVVVQGLEPSYAVGAQLRLTAARYGRSSSLPVAWARQCYTSGGDPGAWEPVGSSEPFTALSQPGCQYVACLMDGTSVAAISQAVAPTFH
jgi:surface-anchored protein